MILDSDAKDLRFLVVGQNMDGERKEENTLIRKIFRQGRTDRKIEENIWKRKIFFCGGETKWRRKRRKNIMGKEKLLRYG